MHPRPKCTLAIPAVDETGDRPQPMRKESSQLLNCRLLPLFFLPACGDNTNGGE